MRTKTIKSKNIKIEEEFLFQIEALCSVLQTNFSSKAKELLIEWKIEELKRLKSDAPDIVKKNFNCSNNKLTSLEGAPQVIGVDLDCSRNQLTSYDGLLNIQIGRQLVHDGISKMRINNYDNHQKIKDSLLRKEKRMEKQNQLSI